MLDAAIAPLHEIAYRHIRDLIVAGQLAPGETISEGQLAEQLGISRTPVREAVKRLAEHGLLEITPRGIRVFRPTAEDVAEVYFLRAAIEGAVVRAAAARITADALETLRSLYQDGERAAERGNVAALFELNGRFHSVIAAACGSGRAGAALHTLDPLVAAYRRLSLMSPDHQRASVADHGRLVELLSRRDGAGAEALMRDHIARSGRKVVEAVRQMTPADALAEASQLLNLDSLAGLRGSAD